MSEAQGKTGTLYLVATPIGNLQDITLRALSILKTASLIAAEDTRHTQKLLTAHGIQGRQAPLVSYREQNHREAARRILEVLRLGNDVALVSDAGTPGLSDPGVALVAEALAGGARVVPVPGPAAAIAAVTASGLPSDRFVFVGFLPRKPGSLRKLLAGLATEDGTLVFYESPHRLSATLKIMTEVLGPRKAVVARELTKQHETFDRGTLPELAERHSTGTLGEVTLVVAGRQEEEKAAPREVDLLALSEVVGALRAGRRMGASEVARLLSKVLGVERRLLYSLAAGEDTGTDAEEDDGG